MNQDASDEHRKRKASGKGGRWLSALRSGARTVLRRKVLWVGATVACLMLSLGLAFGVSAYLTLRWSVSSPEVAVPDLRNQPLANVKLQLESRGLVFEVTARRFDADQPEGDVVEQFPDPGARIKPGQRVRVVVSRGPEKAMVPALAGSSLRRATLALHAAKLERGLTAAVHHDTVELGRVVAQTVPPGAGIFPGDDVSLLVSAGPRPEAWVMPDLRGRPLAVAREVFERLGMRRVRLSPPDAPAHALVEGQYPTAGSRVTAEDRVQILVEDLRARDRGEMR